MLLGRLPFQWPPRKSRTSSKRPVFLRGRRRRWSRSQRGSRRRRQLCLSGMTLCIRFPSLSTMVTSGCRRSSRLIGRRRRSRVTRIDGRPSDSDFGRSPSAAWDLTEGSWLNLPRASTTRSTARTRAGVHIHYHPDTGWPSRPTDEQVKAWLADFDARYFPFVVGPADVAAPSE